MAGPKGVAAPLLECSRDAEKSETPAGLLMGVWSLLDVWCPTALKSGEEKSLAVGNMIWKSQLQLYQTKIL